MKVLRCCISLIGTIACWLVPVEAQTTIPPDLPAANGTAIDGARSPAGQQTYYFLVFSDPAQGQEAEYNRFYDQEHGPDVAAIPGFVSAQRYIMADRQLRAVPLKKPRYLVIYTVVTDDPVALRAEIERRLRSGETRQSKTLTNVQMFTYRQFRAPQKGVGADKGAAGAGVPAVYEQVVFGDATPGNDAAFNTWYDDVHEPSMLSNHGFVEADRAVLSEVQLAPASGRSRYLSLFRIVTPDLAATLRGIKSEDPPAAFDRTRTFGYTYRAIGRPISGDEERARRALGRH
ncbi:MULTISPECIES: hypothetical protein [unclassified Sphingomonas]|uniref:hypothetical protein n=1 Tax=unclassified Sphingomonas TaxID=196159 RepID=UPI00226A0646|nr:MULTISPECIES: hypothetical protein [unclassified Sphingomonas]